MPHLPELPGGTVTFLFTDIEGSTQLLQQLRDAYETVLADQRAILRASFDRWNGREIDTQGDSFFVAFARAGDAIQAVVEAQRALASHRWPQDVTVRLRMGLHTGEPQIGSTGYVGIDVHRAARIGAAGHGGQVLLSQTTRDLVETELPEGVTLRDLGEHRLKDLRRPRHLYQLIIAGLPADFPPLKSLDPRLHNLPIQLTSFIGRERETAEVKRLLTSARLLTLTGVGGTGKSRLALQVAAELLDEHKDGVWLVELAPLADPLLVPQAIASSFGLREEAGRPILEVLLDYLHAKDLLLILDNCEHLIEACAQLADTVLHACPQVRILATSREGLGIAGEVIWLVPSLTLPEARQAVNAETLPVYEAARLFVERAQAAQPSFRLVDQNSGAVAHICRRLDGIPLAIELAAARVKALSVEHISARLDDRFRLLTGGSRTALERHQTLRATLDWSYQLLSAPERVLLQRLSVFSGGWTLEAAEHVCPGGGLEAHEVLDVLAHLVGKSLVVMDSDEAHAARYRMLEMIRQYAREKLLESGEAEQARARHLDFFRRLAEEAEPQLYQANQAIWLERLEVELDNVRAALEWSIDSGGDVESGLRLASELWRFWGLRGNEAEGLNWLEQALAKQDGRASAMSFESSRSRARALSRTAFVMLGHRDISRAAELAEDGLALCRKFGDKQDLAYALLMKAWTIESDFEQATALYEDSLALFQEVGHKWYIAVVHFRLASIAFAQDDYDRATALWQISLAICRELGEKIGIADILGPLGAIARARGNYDQAMELQKESLTQYRALGLPMHIARALNALGETARRQGDYKQAEAFYSESLALNREQGLKSGIGMVLHNLAYVMARRGDYIQATTFFTESLALSRELSNKRGIAECLAGLAGVAGAQGRAEWAARLFGAAEALLEAISARLDPTDRVEYERNVAIVRAQLDEAAFAAAWAAGRAMTQERAIAYAVEDDGREQ